MVATKFMSAFMLRKDLEKIFNSVLQRALQRASKILMKEFTNDLLKPSKAQTALAKVIERAFLLDYQP